MSNLDKPPVMDEAGNIVPESSIPPVLEAPPVIDAPPVIERLEPSLREVGRARMERIGSFFTRMKDGIGNKVREAGESVTSAAMRAKELGVAGFETVMAAPEAITRGVEYGVGAVTVAYEKSRDAVLAAKNGVVEAKNELVQSGKSAVQRGVESVVEAKHRTVEFANRALYRAAERVSRPFLEFQSRRLSHTLHFMAERMEKGTVRKEDFAEFQKIYEHMKGLGAVNE
jgi:hypothetical protein